MTTPGAGTTALLEAIESYYDEVPRASATIEEVGPFTLFVRRSGQGWPFYARPRLGCAGPFTAEDVDRVRARQRELGVPEALEWVHDTTPALAAAIRKTDLSLAEHPLMVLADPAPTSLPDGLRVELLDADDARLPMVYAAVSAGFAETDDVGSPKDPGALREAVASGVLRMVGAFDDSGVLGGGSHSPRGRVTELTGIAVLPRARGRGVGAALTAALVEDARSLGVGTVFLSAGSPRVAAIYGRVGFRTVGTACIAEAAT